MVIRSSSIECLFLRKNEKRRKERRLENPKLKFDSLLVLNPNSTVLQRESKSEFCDIRWAMPAQVQILFVAIDINNSYDVRVVKEADLNSIIVRSLFFLYACMLCDFYCVFYLFSYDCAGCVQFFLLSLSSTMTSRCDDQTNCMASFVPIPPARGSPAGPNQWFCGAPVVRARFPT